MNNDEFYKHCLDIIDKSVENGKIYDKCYKRYFDYKDAITMLDIGFEEINKLEIDLIDIINTEKELQLIKKVIIPFVKNCIIRYYKAGIIDDDLYTEAMSNLIDSLADLVS